MKITMMLISLSLSFSVFANEKKSDQTPYEILKEEYRTKRTRPATYSDLKKIDLHTHSKTSPYNKCEFVHQDNPEDSFPSDLILVQREKGTNNIPERAIINDEALLDSPNILDSLLINSFDMKNEETLRFTTRGFNQIFFTDIKVSDDEGLTMFKLTTLSYDYRLESYGRCWREQ